MSDCKKLKKIKPKRELTKEELKQWDVCVKARQTESDRQREEREWVNKQLH